MPDDLITTQDALKQLGVSKRTLYKWAKARKLERYKKLGAGHVVFWSKRDIDKLRAEMARPRRVE